VQAFYPSPMATATAMYHTHKNPLRRVNYKSEQVDVVDDPVRRKLHKAFLRYHDSNNWPLLREALQRMGRADLIGDGPQHLIPRDQPTTAAYQSPRRKNSQQAHQKRTRPGGKMLTQHTGLPPRSQGVSSKKTAQPRSKNSQHKGK
ncbi:MAG TPA: DUF3362 domain-containing protein, partial [Gammaproteobacteria bacterium]|nr:DUF3362 domain-containing protein [Gammaproteobacteria bacterium]